MKKQKAVIVGAGGLGREVAFLIEETKNEKYLFDLMGFVDDNPALENTLMNHYPVLGNMDWLLEQSDQLAVFIAIGNSKVRQQVAHKARTNTKLSFPTIIADDVKYSSYISWGEGCIVCFGNLLTVNIQFGDFVIINPHCTVGHDAILDDFVTLYPSVNVSGNVHIHSTTEIGTGTQIIQGKSVGAESIIGAGTVIIQDIPDKVLAVGAPAVIKKNL